MLYIMEETALPRELSGRIWELLPREEQEILTKRKNPVFFSQSLAARALLFHGLRQEYGFSEFPKIQREVKGKPYFTDYPEIRFNYSHSDCGILVGISREDLGVDIQKTMPYREKVAKRVAHPREWELLLKAEDPGAPFTKLWCLKEAYVKYLGTGIRFSLDTLDFSEILQGREPKEGACQAVSGKDYAYGVWAAGEIPKLQIINIHQLSF